ncbi:MAG: hypothetical protein H6718_29720 [Polyangiaceae bacterium]|nr:hypothetical protein [Myxococcales bacterium]MCB9589630.1 hypothetical protein [Polyangiaceae bacterium]
MKRFPFFSAGLATWLSVALLCSGCSTDAGDTGGEGAIGGSGSSGGDGGGGSGNGGTGASVDGGGGSGNGGDGGSGGCEPYGAACDCEDGWHATDHDWDCWPWTKCQGDEVAINLPNDYVDRACARLEFLDQFGTAGYDTATAVAANPDGTICVSGARLQGPGDAARSLGGFVRAYGADGSLLWDQSFDGDGANVTDVAIDPAGNCFSLGLASQPQGGVGQWFVRKHTGAGAVAWAATGSTQAQTPQQLEVDPDGNVFASFVTRSPEASTDTPQHTELVKYDASGALSWSASVGNDDVARSYFALAGREAVVVRSPSTVTRLTGEGSVSWEKTYQGAEISNVTDAAANATGYAFLTGDTTSSSSGRLLVLDPSGNGTPLGVPTYLPTKVRSGEDGAVWLQDWDGISAWSAAGQWFYSLGELSFPVAVHDFASIPGFVVLVGEPTQPLAGQTNLGLWDAVVVKLRVN